MTHSMKLAAGVAPGTLRHLPRRRHFALIPLLLASACASHKTTSQASLSAGTGLVEDGGTISVNQAVVPVLSSCGAGQVVARGSAGWECVTPAAPSKLQPGAGIALEGDTVSFDSTTVPATTVWPGTIPYARVTGAPVPYTDAQAAAAAQAAVTWSTVGSTVGAMTPWPGTVPYAQVTGAPAPYTDAAAQAAVTWSTVAPSVPPTAVWPGALPVSSLSGSAPAGTLLTSTGTGWQPVTLSSLGITTTQPINLYVRTDGSDTACNGTANQPASAAPNCAVATPQQAMNLVPLTLKHAVTITIEAGTYQAPAGQTAILEVQRNILPDAGSLTVSGDGTVTLSGGLFVTGGFSPSTAITIQNLTVVSAGSDGINVEAGAVMLSNVTVQGAGGSGILCHQHAFCVLAGEVNVTGCTGSGVAVSHGATLANTGTLTATQNGGDGVDVWNGSTFNSQGTVSATGNTYAGLEIGTDGRVILGGAATFSASGADAVHLDSNAILDAGGGLTVNVSGAHNGIYAVRGSRVVLSGAGAVAITCSNAPVGIVLLENTTFDSSGQTGLFSVGGCITQAFDVEGNSVFTDTGAGPRTWISNGTGATVLTNSTYFHGGFPTGQALCASGGQCP